jgi:hypothetical protein
MINDIETENFEAQWPIVLEKVKKEMVNTGSSPNNFMRTPPKAKASFVTISIDDSDS